MNAFLLNAGFTPIPDASGIGYSLELSNGDRWSFWFIPGYAQAELTVRPQGSACIGRRVETTEKSFLESVLSLREQMETV